MAIVSQKDRYDALMKSYQPQIDSAVGSSNAVYKGQADTVSGAYRKQIEETEQGYNDLFDQNEVQRLINERNIAENMANTGLTDSGLNRTQQTAVQLSAANNAGRIERQRRQAVDSLTQAMTAKLTDIETARANAEAGIRQGYEKMATDAATSAYNADVKAAQQAAEAEQKRQYDMWKTQYNAQAKIAAAQATAAAKQESKVQNLINSKNALVSRNFTGTLKDNGVDSYEITKGGVSYIRYLDTKTGYSVELEKGVNPFTGTRNKDADHGTFSNGYQPNNINKKKLSSFDKTYIPELGMEQTVWTTGGKYYLWDGSQNKYVQVKKKGSSWTVI